MPYMSLSLSPGNLGPVARDFALLNENDPYLLPMQTVNISDLDLGQPAWRSPTATPSRSQLSLQLNHGRFPKLERTHARESNTATCKSPVRGDDESMHSNKKRRGSSLKGAFDKALRMMKFGRITRRSSYESSRGVYHQVSKCKDSPDAGSNNYHRNMPSAGPTTWLSSDSEREDVDLRSRRRSSAARKPAVWSQYEAAGSSAAAETSYFAVETGFGAVAVPNHESSRSSKNGAMNRAAAQDSVTTEWNSTYDAPGAAVETGFGAFVVENSARDKAKKRHSQSQNQKARHSRIDSLMPTVAAALGL